MWPCVSIAKKGNIIEILDGLFEAVKSEILYKPEY